MVSAVGYLYPWDVDGTDPAALDRIAAVGVDGVALAASYHSTRAATPLHPQRRLIDARHSACYVPVRQAAWAGRRLVPAAPDWCAPDAMITARERLADYDVAAWIVLTHNSRLGRIASDRTVRTAFGELYPYALCPSSDEVVEYCVTLVCEIVAQAEPDGVVLEACGPLGVDHGGEHDKTEFAGWTRADRDRLSLCFCAACVDGYRDAGLDPDAGAAQIRAGRDPAPELLAARAATSERLFAAVRDAVPAGVRVTAHASARPGATGSFPHLQADDADTVVGSCWGPDDELTALRPSVKRLGAYVRPDVDPGPLDGVDELHLYHLGLVGTAGMTRLTELARRVTT